MTTTGPKLDDLWRTPPGRDQQAQQVGYWFRYELKADADEVAYEFGFQTLQEMTDFLAANYPNALRGENR